MSPATGLGNDFLELSFGPFDLRACSHGTASAPRSPPPGTTTRRPRFSSRSPSSGSSTRTSVSSRHAEPGPSSSSSAEPPSPSPPLSGSFTQVGAMRRLGLGSAPPVPARTRLHGGFRYRKAGSAKQARTALPPPGRTLMSQAPARASTRKKPRPLSLSSPGRLIMSVSGVSSPAGCRPRAGAARW